MFKFSTKFTIAEITFNLYSDFDTRELVYDIQPHNLNVNYLLNLQKESNQIVNIYIKHSDSRLSINEKFEDGLFNYYIEGDYTPMFKKDYNKQFGLFGNKGTVNRIILHSLEKAGNIILHGCAAISKDKNKVIIGIGSSGSGKSVLTSAAVECGWSIVGTEHIIISSNFVLYKGNKIDNASVQSIEIIRRQLDKAKIYQDKIMTEPTAQKVVVDYDSYMMEQDKLSLTKLDYQIVIVSFKNSFCADLEEIQDNDFLLRMIQTSASEKICAPIIYDNYIVDQELNGNPENRSEVINKLINKSSSNLVIGGDYNNFKKVLNSLA